MRILITGGAGFIGSHLCDAFIRRGDRVLCMDNLITGSLDNIRHLAVVRRFSFIRQDVSRPFSVAGPLNAVLHFASPASPADYLRYPLQTLQAGSLGTFHALEVARRHRARFCLASTSEVYGDPLVHPQTEDYWGHVNPIGPRSVYDEAKRFSEALTMAVHRVGRLQVRIVRIFNTYGPRMRVQDGRVIPNFIAQALKGLPLTVYGRGTQTRSYCYIGDLVGAILKVLDCRLNRPMNVGNPRQLSVLQLARMILKLSGSKSRIVYKPLPADDPRNRCPDITLAKRVLRWEPRVPLEEGLADTIEYFKEKIFGHAGRS